MKAKLSSNGANVFPLSRHIGRRLRRLRVRTRRPAEALANALGISVMDLDDLEIGARQTSLEQLQIAATELDVPVAYFFSDESGGEESFRAALNDMPDVQDGLRLLRAFTRIADVGVRESLIAEAEDAARS